MKQDFKTKYAKYFPSKNFLKITGSFMLIIAVVLLVFFTVSNKEIFSKKKNGSLKTEDQTVLGLIQRDTDRDGVADWEESLWGTDKNNPKTFDNTIDSVYIENKKKGLNLTEEEDYENLTETDRFAREFFTAYAAMKSSGDIDEDAINNFSSALGQKIVNPSLINQYNEESIEISAGDDASNKASYYLTIQNYFEKYKQDGIGDELNLINEMLLSGATPENTQSYVELNTISKAYIEFGKKVIATKVPESLIDIHLKIANNSNNIGISIQNMTKIINDPIVGLSGISEYQSYSDALVSAVEELEANLE